MPGEAGAVSLEGAFWEAWLWPCPVPLPLPLALGGDAALGQRLADEAFVVLESIGRRRGEMGR